MPDQIVFRLDGLAVGGRGLPMLARRPDGVLQLRTPVSEFAVSEADALRSPRIAPGPDDIELRFTEAEAEADVRAFGRFLLDEADHPSPTLVTHCVDFIGVTRDPDGIAVYPSGRGNGMFPRGAAVGADALRGQGRGILDALPPETPDPIAFRIPLEWDEHELRLICLGDEKSRWRVQITDGPEEWAVTEDEVRGFARAEP
ncbi:hypothetical protein [Actinomadura sp. DC4]|uniref:hypothetical protein n=1 Tax=Actinomadura sp. DC4 TaxID=3055069 RepID=UPI0025B16D8C|nr:hypothetical protein [Actinomadura sp. DC4]MDN3358759.1 hypothetical protein [Actinomadura sp. DC4]